MDMSARESFWSGWAGLGALALVVGVLGTRNHSSFGVIVLLAGIVLMAVAVAKWLGSKGEPARALIRENPDMYFDGMFAGADTVEYHEPDEPPLTLQAIVDGAYARGYALERRTNVNGREVLVFALDQAD